MRTSNPPAGRVDPVSRWLVISRASVLPMTLTAAAIAGLLAAYHDENVRWGLFALATVGLVLAHVANNLMNDLFDLEVGADSDSYPRALYAPHPVLSGTISRRGLLTAAIAINAADLAILIVLFVFRGWPMIAFALGGFLLSVAYTAPPLRLKKHGLGEPTVLVVWGPLMVGGAYYAATGHFPFGVFVASLAYALLCTAVLMGKHIDKIPWDAPDGTHTLPVLLGERKARALTQGMMVSFYVLVVAAGGHGNAADRGAARPARAAEAREGVGAVLAAEAGRAARELPDLAAVVRGAGVRAHPARGRPPRARPDRGSHPRLVSTTKDN